MPPSARRARAKRGEILEALDVDTPESIQTPSRKRRKVNGDSARPTSSSADTKRQQEPVKQEEPESKNKDRDSDEETLAEVDPEAEEQKAQENMINGVIRKLKKAEHAVNVAIDYNNDTLGEETKQAFAKLAGQDWTYLVDKDRICIGRPTDPHSAAGQQAAGNGHPTANILDNKGAHVNVEIDLGPEKLVSRLHAEISYDSDRGLWLVFVNGRNGIKVDGSTFRKGDTVVLHSGAVLEVANTQMIWITPNEKVNISPNILNQNGEEEEEDEDEEEDVNGGFPHGHPGHGSRGQLGPSSAPQPRTQTFGPGPQQSFHSLGGSMYASHNAGQPDTPLQSRGSSSHSKSKPSPAYSRGLMLESTEDIDYSQDSAKDIKPPHSYATLIGMAIMSSPEEKMTLSKIYDYIKERFAFYRHSGGGWQNSIRHNLSLNKSFEKVARRTDEPGKGMKWRIVPEQREEFLKKSLSGTKTRGFPRGSSAPSSPAATVAASDRLNQVLQGKDGNASGLYHSHHIKQQEQDVKRSPGSPTPPIGSYPVAKEAYTPDRGSRRPNHAGLLDTSKAGLSVNSPYLHRAPNSAGSAKLNGLVDTALNSPPTLSSSMLHDDMHHGSLVTPLISRHQPRLIPPSTAHLPSQYLNLSSPAPFWKFADYGSTPARPMPDLSPTKSILPKRKASEDTDGEPDVKAPRVQSSSPPLDVKPGDASPLRQISRPVSRKEAGSALAGEGTSFASSTGVNGDSAIGLHGLGIAAAMAAEDEDEGIIDLAKGFQPIGSFHRSMNNGLRSLNP